MAQGRQSNLCSAGGVQHSEEHIHSEGALHGQQDQGQVPGRVHLRYRHERLHATHRNWAQPEWQSCLLGNKDQRRQQLQGRREGQRDLLLQKAEEISQHLPEGAHSPPEREGDPQHLLPGRNRHPHQLYES